MIRNIIQSYIKKLGHLLGWIVSKFLNKSGIFCFFQNVSIGGAEKVHLHILSSLNTKTKPFVFIRFRNNAGLLNEYKKYACVFFIDKLFDFPKFFDIWSAFWQSFFLSFINNHKTPVVLFWNEYYIRNLIPYLNNNVQLIDIIHNLRPLSDDNHQYLNIDLATRIDKRIVVNAFLKEELSVLYKLNGISSTYINRIQIIDNAVDIPENASQTNLNDELNIMFISRPATEKRIHLIGKIATRCKKENLKINFNLVGDIEKMIYPEDKANCTFHGIIENENDINNIYKNNQIIVLTSSSEGFPLVLVEAMSHGLVPITTDVGGIRFHIHHEENGLLLNATHEDEIITTCFKYIKQLYVNKEQLLSLSKNAYIYANNNFSKEFFSRKINHALTYSKK